MDLYAPVPLRQVGDSTAVLQAFAKQQSTVQVNASLIAEGEAVSSSRPGRLAARHPRRLKYPLSLKHPRNELARPTHPR